MGGGLAGGMGTQDQSDSFKARMGEEWSGDGETVTLGTVGEEGRPAIPLHWRGRTGGCGATEAWQGECTEEVWGVVEGECYGESGPSRKAEDYYLQRGRGKEEEMGDVAPCHLADR